MNEKTANTSTPAVPGVLDDPRPVPGTGTYQVTWRFLSRA